jgi:hypothetical protein
VAQLPFKDVLTFSSQEFCKKRMPKELKISNAAGTVCAPGHGKNTLKLLCTAAAATTFYFAKSETETEVLPVLPPTAPLQMILQSEFFTESHQGTLEEFLK